MQFKLLASGSKGNCCIIETKDTRIVIDCGTTKRYLTQRFEEFDVNVMDVDALLITHDHIDHTSQMRMFKDIPVHTPEPKDRVHTRVVPYQSFRIKDVSVTPIPTSHDADVSVGYILDNGSEKLVYITDTGYVRDRDKLMILDADYYIFESNHDPELLMKSKRPYSVKQRILSDTGHLSNADAAQILSEVVGVRTKEVVLAHLSQEANTHELAHEVIAHALEKWSITIKVAHQFEVIMNSV